jgi:hypothetical protein
MDAAAPIPATAAAAAAGPHAYLASAGQQVAVVMCPRALVGRLIGKAGTTVKGIQLFSNVIVEVDQAQDPSRVIMIGAPESLRVADGIVTDIIAGNFKGFALLRELVAAKSSSSISSPSSLATITAMDASAPALHPERQYVYSPGVGLFPQRQVRNKKKALGAVLRPHTPSAHPHNAYLGSLPAQAGFDHDNNNNAPSSRPPQHQTRQKQQK